MEGAPDIVALNEEIKNESAIIDLIQSELRKVIVGQNGMVEGLLIGLLANGHILLEGVPGLAKTLAINSLSKTLGGSFSRVQFTPDLLPSDVIGTQIYNMKEHAFDTKQGPIFSNFVLADEINRAPAKVQSALLEAMQERQVTIGEESYPLPKPFLVMATQNPVEQEGTYPLPEAQLDRFFYKLIVGYPSAEELSEIIARTTEENIVTVRKVVDSKTLSDLQLLVKQVPVASHVKDYAIRLVLASHPNTSTALEITNKFLRFGSSPRGAQSLLLGAKVRALTDARFNVSFDDIAAVTLPALRHRLIVNFEAEAEGVTTDDILNKILLDVPRDPTVSSVAS